MSGAAAAAPPAPPAARSLVDVVPFASGSVRVQPTPVHCLGAGIFALVGCD